MTNKERTQPTVVVMVGLPASGKSTARAKAALANSEPRYEYSTDDKIDAYAEEVGKTYSEVFTDYTKTAMKLADEELAEAIAESKDVLWDQTNMSRKKRQNIINRFPDAYKFECICIVPPVNAAQEAELKRRLNSREGKEIPAFVMANMRKSFEVPDVDEGFNRVIFFNIYGDMLDRESVVELFDN